MLDISQAKNMLTSLGVSGNLAAKAAERTVTDHAGADPLTFLKELRTTLAELSAETAQGTTEAGATAAATTATATATTTGTQTKPFQSTATLYSKGTDGAATTQAAAKAPFSNLAEFHEWESGLGDTFADDYEVPDYVRMVAMSLGGGNDEAVGRYMFFKNHPEFAADYESIRSGNLSKFPTDGSTLVKSDLSKMTPETAAFFKKNPDQLLAAEGFNMDPTLAKMQISGEVKAPAGVNPSEWVMSNKWTADGIVAQNNREVFASAPYIGLDGKGGDTYRLATYDSATNSIINHDGIAYDPITGEVKA